MFVQKLQKGIAVGAIGMLLALVSCKQNSAREARMERPIPVATPTPEPSPEAPLPPPAPPTSAEALSALHRVFGDILVVEPNTAGPALIAGDFNGDNSQDLAVIVRPAAGKLAEINGELANWIIQDANTYFIPPTEGHVVKVPEIPEAKVTDGELLLAIVHGYGPQGWRDGRARQGYLVKNAAATVLSLGPSIGEQSIRKMHLPVRTEIIYELRDKKKGFLFWTGQAYGWHPVKG